MCSNVQLLHNEIKSTQTDNDDVVVGLFHKPSIIKSQKGQFEFSVGGRWIDVLNIIENNPSTLRPFYTHDQGP